MENPIVKRAIGLKNKKDRDKEEAYLIEGFHICMEALNLGKALDQIILSERVAESNPEILQLAQAGQVKTVTVPDHVFKKITDVETPVGVAAIVKKDIWTAEEFFSAGKVGGKAGDIAGDKANYLVLDRIRDPGNGGTLIRTSEAAGFKGVIVLKGSVDVYSPKVVRAGAGSILRQPLLFLDSPAELVGLLKKYGKSLAVTALKGGRSYLEVKAPGGLALVIGNEGQGVSEELMKEADLLIEIPMSGQVESLNAAVAGGILMYWFGKENISNG